MQVIYNGIYEKTPDATDGDPVHMCDTMEWRKMGVSTIVIAFVVLLLIAFAKP